jgi:single-stranded DNA-binding protein
VTGRLKLDTWKDKTTNEDRSRLGVVIEQMQFLRPKSAGDPPAKPKPAPAAEGPGAPGDDVPF